ncbi:MAG: hypothetical protein Q7U87_03645 [bacterium]|nr:hypothetical protein [bacterium]
MAQQGDSLAPAGGILPKSDSLAVNAAKPAGDPAVPAMNVLGYDPIGDEEEMDSMENMGAEDSIPFWLELDPDRDYDPPAQREGEQEQDGRD